jgi:trimeric autotransporter adhesin
MTKLQRFIPQTPDPYLKQSNQLGAVKFGHLNSLVDAINATIYGDYLQLAGDGPMSTTLRALEDPVGNLAQLYLAIDKTAISGPLKIGNSDPNVSSAILQIDSTTQGILFPRLTQVQRDAILSPETGLIIYNSTDSILNIWDGAQWTEIGGGGGLGLKDGLLMTSALTEVVDKENTESALLLSTNRVGISADPTAITQATAVIQASTLNSGIALVTGGAITAHVPDGTGAGGNARGTSAVDLQIHRVGTAATAVASGFGSVLLGGQRSTASGQFSFAMGNTNTASGNNSMSIGGSGSTASSGASAVLGGENNTASTGTHATVVGGQSNTSSGQHSVSGGSGNTASGRSAVAFGQSSDASGDRSFAMGSQTYATADYSFAFGERGKSYLHGQVSQSTINYFYGNYSPYYGIGQASTLTAWRFNQVLSSGDSTVLSLNGSGTAELLIPSGTSRAWNVKVETIAVVTGTSGTTDGVSVGDSLMQDDTILFTKVSGTSSVVGVNNTNIIASTSMGTAGMSFTAGASQELAITFTAPTFTGGGSVTCRVVSKVSLVEVAW